MATSVSHAFEPSEHSVFWEGRSETERAQMLKNARDAKARLDALRQKRDKAAAAAETVSGKS